MKRSFILSLSLIALLWGCNPASEAAWPESPGELAVAWEAAHSHLRADTIRMLTVNDSTWDQFLADHGHSDHTGLKSLNTEYFGPWRGRSYRTAEAISRIPADTIRKARNRPVGGYKEMEVYQPIRDQNVPFGILDKMPDDLLDGSDMAYVMVELARYPGSYHFILALRGRKGWRALMLI